MTDIVFLVHGTFRPDADWIQTDSLLASRVMQTLPPNGTIQKFVWDGRNSFQSRRDAAKSLADKINSFFEVNASGSVHVVAHSHGGNIALLAMQQIIQIDRVASLTTIGTPFIAARVKPWATPAFVATSVSLWAFFLTPVVLDVLAIKGLLAYLPLFGLPIVCWWFTRNSFRLIHAKAELLVHKQTFTTTPLPVPVLCIRYSFDEARIWLVLISLVRVIEYLLGKLYLLLVGDGVLKRAFKVFLFNIFVALVITATGMIIRVPLISWFFIALALLLMTLPSLSAVGSIFTSHKFGLGGRVSAATLLVEIAITVSPASTAHKLEKFSAILGFFRARRRFPTAFPSPHSLGYMDPAAIEAVAKFIKSKVSTSA